MKNNQIYCIPKGCFWWGPPVATPAAQALWAVSILHPDEVSFDIKRRPRSTRISKKCELTDEEVDRLLRTGCCPKKPGCIGQMEAKNKPKEQK